MKRKIHLSLLLLCALFFNSITYAQINYSSNFDTGMNNWVGDYFYEDTDYPCNGGGAVLANIWEWYYYAELYSPLIGVSNGNSVTVTYQYKILQYDSETPTPNSDEWGVLQLYWAASPQGPWTLLQTTDPTNHVASASCATKTISFTPPAGTNLYFGVLAEQGDNYDSDYNVIIDDFTVTQAALTACSGTPATATTVSSATSICNTGTAALSLSPAISASGISIQWQSSANNTTYTNIGTAGTTATYTATQSASTWYRAQITCTASGESVFSTPVQVLSNGLPCICDDVEFDGAVEPITQVTFAGINNTTSATVDGTPSIQNFTTLTPGEVTAGESYPITLKGNTAGDYTNYFTVYFDWNHNGDFTDEGEEYQVGSVTFSTGTDALQAAGTIAVPEDALEGITFMRVFKSYDIYTTDPCSSDDALGYGQIEDYFVNVTLPEICTTEAPEAEALQIVCSGSTVGDLSAEGNLIKWYAAAEGGEALSIEAALTATTYYASVTPEGGCESVERTAVTVEFSVIPPPVADEATQVFCEEGTVADLEVEADGEVTWYSAATGGNVVTLTTALTDSTVYYAQQSVDGCPSATRTAVTATIVTVGEPDAEPTQSIVLEEGTTATLDDITIEADGSLTWYASEEDAINNEGALNPETYTIEAGQTVTLYAVQTIGECASEPYAITVTTTLGSDKFMLAGLQYYPNPVKDVFNVSYKNAIDAVEVYNLVGQRVVYQKANQNNVTLNLANLAAGTYMVKVQSGNETGVVKVVKQ